MLLISIVKANIGIISSLFSSKIFKRMVVMNQNAEIQSQILGYLQKLEDLLLPVLEQLIQQRYPLEVETLAFEIFSDQFSEQFPIRVLFLDHDHSEFFATVNGEARYPSVVDPNLLLIDGVYPQAFEEKYLNLGVDIWSISAQVCLDWFVQNWLKAGGASFPLQAKIGLHDSFSQFDLIAQSWLDEV